MIQFQNMKWQQRALHYLLLLGACGWGISFIFTLTAWGWSTNQLYCMGATNIEYQPLLDYWLKMASSTFGCIGGIYFVCFLNPKKNHLTINYLSILSITVGIVLLISSQVNQMTYAEHPTHYVDIPFCILVGAFCLYFNNHVQKKT